MSEQAPESWERMKERLDGMTEGVLITIPDRAAIRAALARLESHAELVGALRSYLAAKPQCECTDARGCQVEAARVLTRAALAHAAPSVGETK